MRNGTVEERLAKVYESRSFDELAEIYGDWADTYEHDILAIGYSHPLVCLSLLARHVAAGSGPILDAGVGTGLIGPWLQRLGYDRLEGFDASESMLAVARRKDIYDVLQQAFLGDCLPFEDDRFAAAVCMGVFTRGHVGVEGLDDLLRVIRPGGVLIFTVNEALYDKAGFRARIEELCRAERCDELERTPAYPSTPGEASDDPTHCRALALRIR